MQDDQFIDRSQEAAPAVSLREYADILRRRRAVIIQTFVLILVVGVVVTLMSAPTYRASARLLVDSPLLQLNQVNTENPLHGLMAEAQQYRVSTQVELLQSEKVRTTAAKMLGNSLPKMEIAPVADTEIIEVIAEGPDPEVVGKAPNVLLDSYIGQTGDVTSETLDKALKTVTQGAEKAGRTLEETEKKLRRFKERHNVAELEKNRDVQMGTVESLTNSYQSVQAWESGQSRPRPGGGTGSCARPDRCNEAATRRHTTDKKLRSRFC